MAELINTVDQNRLHSTLTRLQDRFHAACTFRHELPLDAVAISFDKNGTLHANFTPQSEDQGYDGILHGGLTAALIDCCLSRCLMANNIVAVTAELNIRYRKPVLIGLETGLEARIKVIHLEKLFEMECDIRQREQLCVKAVARFFRKDK